MNADLEKWEKRKENSVTMLYWTLTVDDTCLLISSLAVLILVFGKYKRRDFFLLVIPILFLARGVLRIPIDFEYHLGNDRPNWIPYILSVAYVYRIGHWIFASQYL